MRYFIIILILTCVCFSQQEPEGAPDPRSVHRSVIIDTFPRVQSGSKRDTIWQYIALRAPSGKVVRTERVIERVIDYDALRYDVAIPFNTVRDSVLTTGCPTCGSEKCSRENFVIYAQLKKPSLDPSQMRRYERRYGNPTSALAMQLLDFAVGLGLVVSEETYSACSDCGTVYHGRRK